MQPAATVAVSGLVVFGTFTSLAAKIVYELDGEGRDGKLKQFEKPWAMTTVMFLGMTFCLPIAYYVEHRSKGATSASAAANGDASEPLLPADGAEAMHRTDLLENGQTTWRQVAMLSIPTFFDLVATVLMNVGLLSVTASVYQMMRGAEMLFAALFAVVFLRRTLNKYHYGGIACCVAGIVLVGMSSLLSGEGAASHTVSPSQILLGMALIVASQAVQAAQITFEDFFMADLAIPPLKIVGYEGLFGSLAMLGVMLPLVQRLPGADGAGIHEDSIDTWHMLARTPLIGRVLALDMAALCMYNIAGMCVTGHLGAVFRTVLETTRTLFVWLVDLLLFYTPLGMGKLGESWTRFSALQALGFVVLVAGTVIYGQGDAETVEEEILAGVYDGEAAVNGERAALTAGVSGPMSVGVRARMTAPISVAGSASLRSGVNMNAVGSLPSSSLSRSLMHRQRLMSPPPGR